MYRSKYSIRAHSNGAQPVDYLPHSKLVLFTMGYTGVAHFTQVVVATTATLVAGTNNGMCATVLTCDVHVMCLLLCTLVILTDIL